MRKLKAQIIDEAGFERTITRLAHEILEKNKGAESIVIVGIRTRGEFIARRIARKIEEVEGVTLKIGSLDITLYRDDLLGKLEQPQLKGTDIIFDLNDKNVILIDDVLYTGRTIRAALDELIDLGRPKTIQLAVLVDRGHTPHPGGLRGEKRPHEFERIDQSSCQGSGRRGCRPAHAPGTAGLADS